MTKTLKSRYKLEQLVENVHRLDKQFLLQENQVRIILEAMDQQDLQKSTAIIDKLRNIQNKGSGVLDSAIEKAIAELNKYTGGGPISQAWSKLKSKVGIDNPLVKVMTFANALETGFKQIPTIVKNNVGALTSDKADQSLLELLTDDEEKRKTVADNIKKALAPKGIFGAFKRIPYTDSEMLTQDLMSMPIKSLNTIVKQTVSGPTTDQIASDIKSSVTGKGDVETKGTVPADTTKASEPTKGTKPPSESMPSNETTPTGETPPRSEEPLASKVVKRVKPALMDLGIKDVEKLINVLDDLGVLKEPE